MYDTSTPLGEKKPLVYDIKAFHYQITALEKKTLRQVY